MKVTVTYAGELPKHNREILKKLIKKVVLKKLREIQEQREKEAA